jgi:hypothetical protein
MHTVNIEFNNGRHQNYDNVIRCEIDAVNNILRLSLIGDGPGLACFPLVNIMSWEIEKTLSY